LRLSKIPRRTGLPGSESCPSCPELVRNPDASHASLLQDRIVSVFYNCCSSIKLAVTLARRHWPISAASIACDSDYLVIDIFCRAYINSRPTSPPPLQAQGVANTYFFPGTFMRCISGSTAAVFASILPAHTRSDRP